MLGIYVHFSFFSHLIGTQAEVLTSPQEKQTENIEVER